MTFHEFKEYFYERLSQSGNKRKAYAEAEYKNWQRCGKTKYSGIESFQVQLSKNKK